MNGNNEDCEISFGKDNKRIMIFFLGCNFKKKVKIISVFDMGKHEVLPHWRFWYDYNFIKACFIKKGQTYVDILKSIVGLCRAVGHCLTHSYSHDNFFDICQGHDTFKLLSLILVKTSIYNPETIWEKCFDAYTMDDFKQTRLYADLHAWETINGVRVIISVD